MNKILPVIIICAVGIGACLAYIVAISIKAMRRKPRRKREFEFEEDVLIIPLGKRK